MSLEKVEEIQVFAENIATGISSSIVAFMIVLTAADVIFRYIFASPFPGVVDLCEMLLAGIVYLTVAYVQRKKGHVRVDVFIDRLQGPPRITLEIAVLILSLVSFVIVTWQAGLYAWDSWITKDHSIGLVAYPIWPAATVVTIGLGLLCLRFMTDLRDYFVQLRRATNHFTFYSITALLPLIILGLFLVYSSTIRWEPMTVGWIMLVIMIIVLIGGLPVSFSLLILGIIGYWILAGHIKTFSIVGVVMYGKIADYTLSVIPMFIIMGHLAYQAGFAEDLYKTVQKWIGHIPGSLAQATVVGGAAFGAACGSGLASCATLAKVCIPPMLKIGIDRSLALGTVAGAAPLATMIPPSVTMVVYAVITDQSVGKLLIAGIIPGIVAAMNFCVMIYIRCRINPNLAPRLPRAPWRERIVSLKYSWGVAMLAAIVMGGIWSGVFTPTEAGGLGAFGAFVMGILNKRLTMEKIKEALLESVRTTAMIFLIIACALFFGFFLGISRIPSELSDMIVGLEVPRIVILIGIIILYLIAGCFIDMLAFAFLTLPIIFPAIVALGYDPIWFGVITVLMFEVALISPPFGLNLFILRGVVPGATMQEIIRGIIWFAIMNLVITVQYVAFPQLATWLPSMMSR